VFYTEESSKLEGCSGIASSSVTLDGKVLQVSMESRCED